MLLRIARSLRCDLATASLPVYSVYRRQLLRTYRTYERQLSPLSNFSHLGVSVAISAAVGQALGTNLTWSAVRCLTWVRKPGSMPLLSSLAPVPWIGGHFSLRTVPAGQSPPQHQISAPNGRRIPRHKDKREPAKAG
ncbi:hypothetical protein VTG60DRAFT_3193 [Thermothelomyces hinnuleus]